MESFKAAIFDLDGTLIDSMYVWEKVDNDFLTARGIPPTSDYSEAIKAMYFRAAAEYTIDRYDFSETPEQIMQIWLDMAYEEYSRRVQPKDGVLTYLEYLRQRNIPMAIATSSCDTLTLPVLKHCNISSYFSSICYTHDVGRTKDFPDVYLLAAERLGVSPSDCMVFEDIPQGIKSAKYAGMKTVAVYDKHSKADQELLKSLADRYIYSFCELVR